MIVTPRLLAWLLAAPPDPTTPPHALRDLARLDVVVVAPPPLVARSPSLVPATSVPSPDTLVSAALRDLVHMAGRACLAPHTARWWAGDSACDVDPSVYARWAAETASVGQTDCLVAYDAYLAHCHPTHADRLVVPLLVASTGRSAAPSDAVLAALHESAALASDSTGWLAHQPDAAEVCRRVSTALTTQAAEVQLHWWPRLPPRDRSVVADLYRRAAALPCSPTAPADLALGRGLALLASPR